MILWRQLVYIESKRNIRIFCSKKGGFMGKESKNFRTLDMYVRLCEGKNVNKAEEARRFNVDERSIQRDIDDIRAFLDERSIQILKLISKRNNLLLRQLR